VCFYYFDVLIARFTGTNVLKPWNNNRTSPFAIEYRRYLGLTCTILIENTRFEKIPGVKAASYVHDVVPLIINSPKYRHGLRFRQDH